jgi:NTP pyrophosphatase (non-canonical NTP hydrolase)
MKLDTTKLAKVINHFGKLHQIVKLGEEVGELNKAILNYENGYRLTNNEITEEIADVYLLLKQVELMYQLDKNEIKQVMLMKLDRVFDKYNVEE